MGEKVIYVGGDPNIKNMQCTIESQEGDILTLSTGNEILGKIVFKAHKSKVSRE